MKLALRPTMWVKGGRRPVLSTENPIQYDVTGLPDGHSAVIGHKPDTKPIRWQIWHEMPSGVFPHWQGDYETKEDALAAISATLSN
jgi:hypothetical protein